MRSYTIIVLLLSACTRDQALIPVGASTGALQGIVQTPDGARVANATVRAGDDEVHTDADGNFYLHDLAPGRLPLTVEAPGYSSTVDRRDIVAGTPNYTTLTVMPAEQLTWDPQDSDGFTSASGVSVHFYGGVRSEGVAYDGPVDVSVSLINTPQDAAAAPGAMRALRDSGEEGWLVSYGMAEVRMTDDLGNRVQPRKGARLTLPMAAGAPYADGDSAPLFWFDEDQGLWVQTGTGLVTDGHFVAEVDHFSWYNCDAYQNTNQCATGTVVMDGQPVVNQPLEVTETSSVTTGSFSTDEHGRFQIALPTATEVGLSLQYSGGYWTGEVFETPAEAASAVGCVDLGTIEVTSTDQDGDSYPSSDWGGSDCDDADPDIHPQAEEVWYDDVDQDCASDDDWDQDGDGVYPPEAGGKDCDDTDPTVQPTSPERCNSKDDNCDGLTDDEDPQALGQKDWFVDADADTWGAGDPIARACTAPDGDTPLALRPGDCDDARADINPDIRENFQDRGEDANCDGETAALPISHTDIDGDGFYTPWDCDDREPDAYPGRPETGCDGIDNNCNGLVDTDPARPPLTVGAGGEASGYDYASIQDALDAALVGDCVVVAPGTYREELTLRRSVGLSSRDGADATWIQSDDDAAITASAEDGVSYVHISGFTLTPADEGSGTHTGLSLNGVRSDLSELVVTDYYSGLYLTDTTATLSNLTLSDNLRALRLTAGSEATLSDSEITGGAYYGVTVGNSILEADHLLLANPKGGVRVYKGALGTTAGLRLTNALVLGGERGVSTSSARVHLSYTTVVGAEEQGVYANGGSLSIDNSIVALGQGCGVCLQYGDDPTELDLRYTDLYGNADGDLLQVLFGTDHGDGELDSEPTHLSADPGFRSYAPLDDWSLWDLTLAPGSALIDAGDPALLDADGSRADVGAYGGAGGAW